MRDFDRIIGSSLPPAKGFEQPARFLAATASQFRNRDRSRDAVDNLIRVPPQQALVGAGKPVLRQMADDFEQSRTYIVVEVFGGQFLLPRPSEAFANICRKLVRSVRGDRGNKHGYTPSINSSRSERPHIRIGSAPGTSCEMSAATCTLPCAANRPS